LKAQQQKAKAIAEFCLKMKMKRKKILQNLKCKHLEMMEPTWLYDSILMAIATIVCLAHRLLRGPQVWAAIRMTFFVLKHPSPRGMTNEKVDQKSQLSLAKRSSRKANKNLATLQLSLAQRLL